MDYETTLQEDFMKSFIKIYLEEKNRLQVHAGKSIREAEINRMYAHVCQYVLVSKNKGQSGISLY